MALPKKVIPNINLVPPKILLERREQLLEDITNDGTYLPKNLDYADLDRGFLDFVKNELKTIVDGKIIPTVDILITTQNWAQFTQTWSFQDLNGNTEPPFITVVRVPEVKYGTNPATLYNIPNQKEFFYAAVPTWNGNTKGLDIYKIPQPVPVDISFNVKIICNRMRELNEFNKNVIQTFASRQAYTKVNGHFIPIINSNISDESVTQIDKRRFYIQNYDFTMLGFILDQDKFEVAPAVSRVLNVFETNFKPINRKRKIFPVNEGVFDLTVQAVRNSPVVRTINVDYTGTFTILSTQNVSSYDLFVSLNTSSEFDFYGTNVINFEVNTGDRLRFEITQQNNDPTSIITYAVSLIGSPQNLTFDLLAPSVTPSNTVTPTNTPTNTPTPSVTPSQALTPTSSITPTPTPSLTSSPTSTPTTTPTPSSTSTSGCETYTYTCYNYQITNTSSSEQPLLLIYSACTSQPTVLSISLVSRQTTTICAVAYTIVVADSYSIVSLGTCGSFCISFTNIFVHVPNLTPSSTPITPTGSITPTLTNSPSNTLTPSVTLTNTPSITPTISLTPSITPTLTSTQTVTPTETPILTPTRSITPTLTNTSSSVKYFLYGILSAGGSNSANVACEELTTETAILYAYSVKPLNQLSPGDVIYYIIDNTPIISFANRYRAFSATQDMSTPKYVVWWSNTVSTITSVALCSVLVTPTPMAPTPTMTNTMTPSPSQGFKYSLWGVQNVSMTPYDACGSVGDINTVLSNDYYSLKPLNTLTVGDKIYNVSNEQPVLRASNSYQAFYFTANRSTPSYVIYWENSGNTITSVSLCSSFDVIAYFFPCFSYENTWAILVRINHIEVLENGKGTIFLENPYGIPNLILPCCWQFFVVVPAANLPPQFNFIDYYYGTYYENLNICNNDNNINCPVSSGTTYFYIS